MKYIATILLLSTGVLSYAAQDEAAISQQQMTLLRQQTLALQTQHGSLPKNLATSDDAQANKSSHLRFHRNKRAIKASSVPPVPEMESNQETLIPTMKYESTPVQVHTAVDVDPESADFYPTALVTGDHVLTYIAGTPVISSPYLGSRPAFDGSDYIVNISSINRDIRLMQQRRSLERAYTKMGYAQPDRPILALSGAVVPFGSIGRLYFNEGDADWNLGSSELDLAAILNKNVEAYMALAYNAAPPANGMPRVTNSAMNLNMGFVNIGDLDRSPFYSTLGQLYVPFGRYSTAMVSATLPMMLTRIKSRPIILGYKSQKDSGPFAAVYGYRGEATAGTTAVGGANLGYIANLWDGITEIGASFVSSVNDANGFQSSGGTAGTFGGFGSSTNGNEDVKKIPAAGVHISTSFDRYSITAEWVTATSVFPVSDLSFNGKGAQPQAFQLEGGATFESFKRPSSVGASWQWSNQALALNLPRQRINAVYNISVWKDTVESLEYRHDIDYGQNCYANGAAPTGSINANTVGSGSTADTVMLQIGVYF